LGTRYDEYVENAVLYGYKFANTTVLSYGERSAYCSDGTDCFRSCAETSITTE
jgi:hypothetical protein